MLMKILRAAVVRLSLALITPLFLVSVAFAEAPEEADIGAFFGFGIPAVWSVETFDVEATQNVGTEVRPVFVSRFKSDVILEQDTFSIVGQVGAHQILRPVLPAGHRMTIFGFAESVLEEGRYRHIYDLQGAALTGAGKTIAEIGGLTVLEGSEELAALQLAAETAQERARIAAEEQQRAREAETARLRAEAEARAQAERARAEQEARLEAARMEARNAEALAAFAGTWVSGPIFLPDGFPQAATSSGGVYNYRLAMPPQPAPRGFADVTVFIDLDPEKKLSFRANYQYDAAQMTLLVSEPGGNSLNGRRTFFSGNVWQFRTAEAGITGEIIDRADNNTPNGSFAEFVRE